MRGQSKRAKNKAGVIGEKAVSAVLSQLPYEYIVLNNVLLRTRRGTAQIDHVIVSPYGIFVIETKNYCGLVCGTDNQKYWRRMYPNRPPEFFYSPVLQNRGHIKALSEALNISPEYMLGLVVFTGRNLDMSGVCSNYTLYINYLLRCISLYTNRVIPDDCVFPIAQTIRSLDVNSPSMVAKHRAYVRKLMKQNSAY